MRTVWITDEPMPASIQTIEAALAAGAGEILHGIPPGLADLIPAGATGLVDLDDEPSETAAEPVEITLADVAAALRDPLADLTPSSESTTVRTAILNQRAALDALLGQLETP